MSMLKNAIRKVSPASSARINQRSQLQVQSPLRCTITQVVGAQGDHSQDRSCILFRGRRGPSTYASTRLCKYNSKDGYTSCSPRVCPFLLLSLNVLNSHPSVTPHDRVCPFAPCYSTHTCPSLEIACSAHRTIEVKAKLRNFASISTVPSIPPHALSPAAAVEKKRAREE
jgi:hypothetical protein